MNDNNLEMLSRALSLHQAGKLADAELLYRLVLRRDEKQFDALHLLGVLEGQRGRYVEAHQLIDRALKFSPRSVEAHTNLGCIFRNLGRRDEALASFDKALAIRADFVLAWINRGAVLSELDRPAEALESFDRALAIEPNNIDAIFNRGNAQMALARPSEALDSFNAVLSYQPAHVDVLIARANALQDLQRNSEALASLAQALAIDANNAMAFNNRGTILIRLGFHQEALESFGRAIASDPAYAMAYQGRGTALMVLQRDQEAVSDFETALRLDPGCNYALGNLVTCRMQICDWLHIAAECTKVIADARAGKNVVLPFSMLAIESSSADQLATAKLYVANRHPAQPFTFVRKSRSHDKIKLAYLSADFRDHPVSVQIVRVLENHDRSQFDVSGISLIPDAETEMLGRLKNAFDRYINVHDKTDADVARLLDDMEIDIAIDLMGHTLGARTSIFAARPAPIQVNYLGYAGTMGANYIDYIIADRFVIPPDAQQQYIEKVAYLPDVFMPSDSNRAIAAKPSRSAVGLPDQGIVFCCFNNTYKITPDLFDIWTRLLKEVDGSVLWLSAGTEIARRNLMREAGLRGVAPGRLIFATRVARNEDHLARCGLADIFLDTFYFNAHATAADALWAGVPIVTCPGASFAARVAGSLVNAIGLSELVVASREDYFGLALRLAQDSVRRAAIRDKLARHRNTYPLFDTDRYRGHLESAYTEMWRRHEEGLAPDSFTVSRD